MGQTPPQPQWEVARFHDVEGDATAWGLWTLLLDLGFDEEDEPLPILTLMADSHEEAIEAKDYLNAQQHRIEALEAALLEAITRDEGGWSGGDWLNRAKALLSPSEAK